jgi:hypothetical protein
VSEDELAQTLAPAQPLAVDHDDILAALAARRELGPDSDAAVVAAFLDHAGLAIDIRVDQRVADHMSAGGFSGTRTGADRQRIMALVLALCSLVLSIPITGIVLTQAHGSAVMLAVLVWVGIIAVNVSFHFGGRR